MTELDDRSFAVLARGSDDPAAAMLARAPVARTHASADRGGRVEP